ncbi:hypothetical protein FHE66_05775 [Georgenia sp. 311]|uniref:hypothetical protein n=1 Tax=Georgenia sp. 311 TaxID=2585134 RepID=UPI0011126FD9|nr:hypothetical protein [Georgenia sp. 311]TNC18644.1 hypothetical protein FHE66_05775 [Georgenia sp. 311]
MIDDEQVHPSAAAPRRSARPAVVAAGLRVATGVAGAVLGLLPWLATGMRLPLQNLWATSALPEDMPLTLLPFSQYAVVEVAALLVVGGAAAGALARWRVPSGLGSVAAGLLAVQLGAVAQTSVTVHAGLAPRTESTVYLVGLLALSVLAVAVGVGAMVLIARAPRAGVLIGVTVAALLLAHWLDTFLASPLHDAPAWATDVWLRVRHLVGAVLIGATAAWTGLRTAGRVVAALGALLALWLVPALLIGVTNAVGSRILARSPADMLEYGVGVFRLAATTPSLVVPPLLVAVGVTAAGLLVLALRRRSVGRPA